MPPKPSIDWFKVGSVCHALRMGTTIERSCREAGLAPSTFKRWLTCGRRVLADESKPASRWTEADRQYAAIAHQVDVLQKDLVGLAYEGLRYVVEQRDARSLSAVVAAAKVILDRTEGPVTQAVRADVGLTAQVAHELSETDRVLTPETVGAMEPGQVGEALQALLTASREEEPEA